MKKGKLEDRYKATSYSEVGSRIVQLKLQFQEWECLDLPRILTLTNTFCPRDLGQVSGSH